MSTISTVTDRADGEVLTAAKYNADHGVHEQNATNLNADKVEIDNFNNEHGPTGAHSADEVRDSIGLATNDAVRFRVVTADSVFGVGIYSTSQDFTNLTTMDFNNIPQNARRIDIAFVDLSLSLDPDNFLVQIGDSDGLETSGYQSESTNLPNAGNIDVRTSTSGFIIFSAGSATAANGIMTLLRMMTGDHQWVETHASRRATSAAIVGSGEKTLSGDLDRIRITSTVSATIDAGKVNVLVY